jgi:DNA-binding NarL/FixJ family response regulator
MLATYASRPSAPALRVIVVDDQPLVRDALSHLLSSMHGVEVVASSGNMNEATARIRESRPDVVLLDVLSAGDAFSGAAELFRLCPEVRTVILDDAPCDTNVIETLRIGLSGYLTKQQSPGEIVAGLWQVMSGLRVFVPVVADRLVLSSSGARLKLKTNELVSRLTPRELEVMTRLAYGLSVKQCAKSLGIGASTAGNHKSRLMKKLGVHKTVELVRLAMREGLIPKGTPAAPDHGMNPNAQLIFGA